MFISVLTPAGVGVALIRRRLLAAPGDPMRSRDAPAWLLGWAVGLLADNHIASCRSRRPTKSGPLQGRQAKTRPHRQRREASWVHSS